MSGKVRFLVGSFTEELPYIFGGLCTDPAPAGLSLWELDYSKIGSGDPCARQLSSVPLRGPGALIKIGNLIICGRETAASDGDMGRTGKASDELNLVMYDPSQTQNKKCLTWTERVTSPLSWTTCDFHNCNVDGMNLVISANYFSSNLCIFELIEQGSSLRHCLTFEADSIDPSRVRPKRQHFKHAHDAKTHPRDSHTLFVPHLGCDCIVQFDLSADVKSGQVSTRMGHVLNLPPGSGPRTICFHPQIPDLMYVSLELSFHIGVIRATPDGRMSLLQKVSTVPDGYEPGSCDITGVVKVDLTGSTIFSSTRGHESIFTAQIDSVSGMIKEKSSVWTGSGGCSPRFISVDPTNEYLFVLNHGGFANITVFKIQRGTKFTAIHKVDKWRVGCPTWIEWIADPSLPFSAFPADSQSHSSSFSSIRSHL